jgi:hypothetical protein
MKKTQVIVAIVAVLVVILFVIPFGGFVTRREQEINIKTGQARHSRYVFWVKTSDRIEEMPLSVALAGQTVDAAPIQAWHRVNTFTFRSKTSPEYSFHGALAHANQLKLLSEMCHLTADQEKDFAHDVLTLWQTSGSCRPAQEHIDDTLKRLQAA